TPVWHFRLETRGPEGFRERYSPRPGGSRLESEDPVRTGAGPFVRLGQPESPDVSRTDYGSRMSARLEQSSAPGDAADVRSSLKGLKVLHVGKYYPPYMGGIETHLQALSRELAKIVDLRVIVSNDQRGTTSEVADGVNLLRVGTPLKLFSTPLS